MNPRAALFLPVVLLGAPAFALDPAACSAAAKQIDDRIAAGDHPQQNIAIATQIRDGIVQSCSFLDEATVAQMLQGLDQLLPDGSGGSAVPEESAAEREAEREAQRAEADRRQAEREKRRAAERAREEAEQSLVSDVVRKPPAGRSVKGQLMSRPDKMWGASIVDWDVHLNGARLLYRTTPSREQGRLPDAARHYYVVEFDRDDSIEQHHVVETSLARTVTAGLVRGRDEIILQWHEGGSDPSTPTLERWSISNAEMMARSPAPRMQGPRGALTAEHHFHLVTEGGDLFYATTVALGTGPSPKTGVSWMLASLDGEVRDQGLIEYRNDKVLTSSWFHSANAGAGLMLDMLAAGDNGIDSQWKPDPVQVGSVEIRPLVSSERRLYVVGGAETGTELPAIERRLMWLGLENVDPSMMISGESTRVIEEAESEFRAEDTAVSQAVAGRNRMAIAPSRGGHAVIIENNQRDTTFPPTRGLWLQEFAAGQPRRDTYLNPDAEHLGTQFNMLASDGGDNLYVAGSRHVLLLNGAREVSAYAEYSAIDTTVKAMIADGSSVWLFGEHYGANEAQQQMWVGRVQF